jgi:hypothetical protein
VNFVDGALLTRTMRFDVDALPRLWSPAGLVLIEHHRFQLGLNNLVVFERQA